jgi:hypothetical protein
MIMYLGNVMAIIREFNSQKSATRQVCRGR